MFDWDYSFLYENYKSIRKDCYLDGYLLPYCLGVVEIPLEYNYTHKEWSKILKKGTKKNRENLISMSKIRRQTEIQILTNKHRTYKDINVYHYDELQEFLKKYPRYKKIIK